MKISSSEHVVNTNCFFVFVSTFRTIYVHNTLWAWNCHVLNLQFNEQSLVILWVSWYKNKCFWKGFTCKIYFGHNLPYLSKSEGAITPDPLGSDRPVEPYDDWMNCRSEELCKGVSKFLTSTTQRFWTGLDTSVRSRTSIYLFASRGISLFHELQIHKLHSFIKMVWISIIYERNFNYVKWTTTI